MAFSVCAIEITCVPVANIKTSLAETIELFPIQAGEYPLELLKEFDPNLLDLMLQVSRMFI